MMLQRAVAQSSRVIACRAGPAFVSRRYTETGTGRQSQPRAIGNKEKAQEDLFIYEREKERAKKLREEIARQQAELDEIDKKVSEKEKRDVE